MLLVTVVVLLRLASMGSGLSVQSSAGGNVGGLSATVITSARSQLPTCTFLLPGLLCYAIINSSPLKPLAQLNSFFL